MYFDKLMEKVMKGKKELANSYGVDTSRIVYIGDNKYIVVTNDGRDVRI